MSYQLLSLMLRNGAMYAMGMVNAKLGFNYMQNDWIWTHLKVCEAYWLYVGFVGVCSHLYVSMYSCMYAELFLLRWETVSNAYTRFEKKVNIENILNAFSENGYIWIYWHNVQNVFLDIWAFVQLVERGGAYVFE
jgi:hypothetical protein